MRKSDQKFQEYCSRLGKCLTGQQQISYYVGWLECKDEILKMLKDNSSKYLTFDEARKDIEKNL